MKRYMLDYNCVSEYDGTKYHWTDTFIADNMDDAIAQCEQISNLEGCKDVHVITVWVDTGTAWECV